MIEREIQYRKAIGIGIENVKDGGQYQETTQS